MFKRFGYAIFAALLCLSSWAAALSESGVFYDTFVNNYSENITFINDNTGRRLLPLIFNEGKQNGRSVNSVLSGALSAELVLDDSGKLIEECRIVLAAPVGLSYGTSAYEDFTTSGYHSYALLMAMDASLQPADRYALVTRVNDGLAATSEGQFFAQVGAYSLSCTREDGTATLAFTLGMSADLPIDDADDALDTATDPDAGDAPDDDTFDEEGGFIG